MYHIFIYGAFIRYFDCRTVHKFIYGTFTTFYSFAMYHISFYGTFICLICPSEPTKTEKAVILSPIHNKITAFLIVQKNQ